MTTDCVGTDSGTGHLQAFPTIIYSYVTVVADGDGEWRRVRVNDITGSNYSHKHIHVRRPERDGGLLADEKQQQHPYPTCHVKEKPRDNAALFTRTGERKGSLNIACSSAYVGHTRSTDYPIMRSKTHRKRK